MGYFCLKFALVLERVDNDDRELAMSDKVLELIDQTMELEAPFRLMLAEKLIHSVDPSIDEGVNAAWREEISQRLESLRSGTATTITLQDLAARI